MAKIYARETKLKNVAGRVDYITNDKRQEHIILTKENMENEWSDYIDFENQNKKSLNDNIQARETVIALPNDLLKDKKELEKFCDDLGQSLYGNNRDYQYAVHLNKSKTNLHVHFIYTERERVLNRQPKIYKRDIYFNKKTGKTCSKDDKDAVLRCKKGDIQKDKDGNIKYNNDKFTIKDKKFNNKNWLKERNLIIKDVFRRFERDISLFDSKFHIAQKKLFKGANIDYLDYAKKYNVSARRINNIYDNEIAPRKKDEKLLIAKNKELKSLLVKSSHLRSTINDNSKRNFLDNIFYKFTEKNKDVEELKVIEKKINKVKKDIVKITKKEYVHTYFYDFSNKLTKDVENWKNEATEVLKLNTFNKYVAQRKLKINKTREQELTKRKDFSINDIKLKNKEINQNNKIKKHKKKGLSL